MLDGMYDYFNLGWYEYIGLIEEEFMGLGW